MLNLLSKPTACWRLLLLLCTVYGNVCSQQVSFSYSVLKLDFNSPWSEISPVILPDGLAFVSNREDELGVSRHSRNHDEPFYKLYFAARTDSGFKKPVRLSGDVNATFSEGPLSLTMDRSTMYFSRNVPVHTGGETKNKANMGIYVAHFKDGVCSHVQPFPYNSTEYSLAHPSISPNNNFIIFASNMAGGFGGSDLYVSYLKDGKWGRPLNLGNAINTARNEVFPYVNQEGRLFFASEGHEGLGGLDIFSAAYRNFEWTNIQNLGAPFNSQSDDFGYTESADKSFGFFSSDREKGDRDDIYQFQVSTFTFSECDTLTEMNYCRTFYEENTMDTDSLPLIYEWDFGNGIKKRGLEVNHCFNEPGKHKVNLNIIDLITDQLYMNEASYELDIAPIKGPYFSLPDTTMIDEVLSLDASRSNVENATIQKYYWDFGDGVLQEGKVVDHAYKTGGRYIVKLGMNCSDSTSPTLFSKCAIKPIYVVDPTYFRGRRRFNYKPYYQIKDKKGNRYKIQLATSKEKLDLNAHYFKQIGKVEEYYDRGIFGYTVGNYQKPELCYPELKKLREKGFKEAIVIAMKENKVVSGLDSSFFVKLPSHFRFVRVVSMHGKVMDHNGKPVNASIQLEDLNTGTLLDEFKTDSSSGRYRIELPADKAYAYYIYKEGYFPFSNYLDLTKANDLSEIRSDIFLMSINKMSKDSVPVRVNNIFFEPGSYNLKPEARFELKRIADFFKRYNNATLVVDSHTDNIGDRYAKIIVSKQRADVVKNFLIMEGCAADKIQVFAYGESKPITLNPKLQPINNRIEMRLLIPAR